MQELKKVSTVVSEMTVKEYRGQRVVTFREIDDVHQRPEGTAKRNFATNEKHFIEGVDYFRITHSQKDEFRTLDIPNRGLTLITESGYLMLVKSFTDDLAWQAQRELINGYFRSKEQQPRPACIEDVLIQSLQEMKAIRLDVAHANERIDNMQDVIRLDTTGWREESHKLVVKIAQQMGGNEYIRDVQAELYELVEGRAGVSLSRRLAFLRQRMAEEGVSKTKRDKMNRIDVIERDKKLVEIYVAIVKEMAVKYGVTLPKGGAA